MHSTVLAILNTPDLDRALRFYTGLFDTQEFQRVPKEGPTFFVGLRIGDSDLGLVSDGQTVAGEPGRILISVDVPDVDALLDRVTELGGQVSGPPNDMPWGQRVAHVRDPDGNVVNLTHELT